MFSKAFRKALCVYLFALHWGLAAERGLPPVWWAGLSPQGLLLWLTGSVALRHVGSSWTRDQTLVSCIGRRIFFTTEPPGKPLISAL